MTGEVIAHVSEGGIDEFLLGQGRLPLSDPGPPLPKGMTLAQQNEFLEQAERKARELGCPPD